MAREKFVVISDVERATGVARATLRIWERRYGFPRPTRSGNGERTYPPEQVEKLKLVQQLLDKGFRPGRIMAMSTADLLELKRAKAASKPRPTSFDEPILHMLRTYDSDGLRRVLSHMLMDLGLERFVTEKIAPLNVLVGDAWESGEIRVFEEHLYVECLQSLLRNAIFNFPPPPAGASPRILLATFPEEPHGLGLLMVQAMLALERCPCVSLGVELPVGEIAEAAEAHLVDFVGLSFTISSHPRLVVRGLQELRQKLPSRVGIWVGGNCPVIHRRKIEGVTPFSDIAQVRPAITRYRDDHALPPQEPLF